MPGFETIITDVSKRSYADVTDRQPTLELVMAGAMEDIRNAHGSHGCGRFQACESGGIVDHVIGEKNFLSAARLEVASRGIVHAAGEGDSGKKQQIRGVPEGMRRESGRGGLSGWGRSQGWRRIARLRFGR